MVVRQKMRADEITAKMGAGDTTTFQKTGRKIGEWMKYGIGGGGAQQTGDKKRGGSVVCMGVMLRACGCFGGGGRWCSGGWLEGVGWWWAVVIVGIGEEQTFQVGSEVRLGEGEGRIGMASAAGSEERGIRNAGSNQGDRMRMNWIGIRRAMVRGAGARRVSVACTSPL